MKTLGHSQIGLTMNTGDGCVIQLLDGTPLRIGLLRGP
jgi:hypothetical protein